MTKETKINNNDYKPMINKLYLIIDNIYDKRLQIH